MKLKLKIILRAVHIRMKRGEQMAIALDRYKTLSAEERSEIRSWVA